MNERKGCPGGGHSLWCSPGPHPLCPVGPGQGDHRGCGGAREGVQMLWTELCPPKSTAALTPHPDTVVRDEAFEEGIKVK